MFTSTAIFCSFLINCDGYSIWSKEKNGLIGSSYWSDTSRASATGMILPALVIGLIVVSGFIVFFKEGFCSRKKPPAGEGSEEEEGPEEQVNLILCHEDKAKFEYVLILRVGCPTPNFDMKRGYIDLEILDNHDDMLGNQVRFKCSLLKDQICGEMHMLIGSLKPLTKGKGKGRISGIRISHGDVFGSIFLYEYVLVNAQDDEIVEVRRFNTYITKKHVIYRGVSVANFEDENEEEGMNFPELPRVLLTNVEALIILALVVILSGTLVIIFEYYNWYPVNQIQDGSLVRSLLDVLFITTLVSPFGMIVLIFKFYIKKNLITNEFSVNEANLTHWQCLSQTFLGFMTTTSLALSAILVIYGRQISFTKSMYWFGSTLIISTCLVGTWQTLNDWFWFRSFFENESQVMVAAMLDRKRESAMRRFYASHSRTRKIRNRTIFFSQRFTRRVSTHVSSNARSIGPKLVNPKMLGGKKKKTKVKNMVKNLINPKSISSSAGGKFKSQSKNINSNPPSTSKTSSSRTCKFKKSTSNKGKSRSSSKYSSKKRPHSHSNNVKLVKS